MKHIVLKPSAEPCDALTHHKENTVMSQALIHRNALIGFFTKRIGDASEAEDLAQEVFLRLCQRNVNRPVERVEQYLFQIAGSVLTDRFRRRLVRMQDKVESLNESHNLFTEISPELLLIGKESLNLLLTALKDLPQRTQDIFILRAFEGYKYAEIAALVKISERAVQKNMAKALGHLASALDVM